MSFFSFLLIVIFVICFVELCIAQNPPPVNTVSLIFFQNLNLLQNLTKRMALKKYKKQTLSTKINILKKI